MSKPMEVISDNDFVYLCVSLFCKDGVPERFYKSYLYGLVKIVKDSKNVSYSCSDEEMIILLSKAIENIYEYISTGRVVYESNY